MEAIGEEGEEEEEEDDDVVFDGSSLTEDQRLAVLGLEVENTTTTTTTTTTTPSLEAIARGIANGRFKNILGLTGAGISVSAGIPDFRTPGTGLYDSLAKWNLPRPECMFDIDYFRQNPKPFFALAKELYPGPYRPTRTHCFLRLLSERGLLLRNYSQNVDCLGFPTTTISR
jgi:hypothetical protein